MLSTDPEALKQIVLVEKPPISGDSFNFFEGALLEKLVANIGTLASVYSKPPEQFVKKIQDKVIERFDTEFIEEEAQGDDELDSAGQKKNYEDREQKIEGFGDLLDLEGDLTTTPTHSTPVEESKSGIDELLSLGSTSPSVHQNIDPLAELLGTGISAQTFKSMAAPQSKPFDEDILGILGGGTSSPVHQSNPPPEYCRVPDKQLNALTDEG